MSNFRFFLLTTSTLLLGSLVGFYTGLYLVYDLLIKTFGFARGEDVLILSFINAVFAVLGFFIGILISLIIIHRMGRKWGKDLSFGSHPVLKLTVLSFISFVVILIVLLNINYYFNK